MKWSRDHIYSPQASTKSDKRHFFSTSQNGITVKCLSTHNPAGSQGEYTSVSSPNPVHLVSLQNLHSLPSPRILPVSAFFLQWSLSNTVSVKPMALGTIFPSYSHTRNKLQMSKIFWALGSPFFSVSQAILQILNRLFLLPSAFRERYKEVWLHSCQLFVLSQTMQTW